MVCSYMPESLADKCEDYVQEYGDEIIKLIVSMEMDPDQVCAALGLCSTLKASSPTMFGTIIFDSNFTSNIICFSIIYR